MLFFGVESVCSRIYNLFVSLFVNRGVSGFILTDYRHHFGEMLRLHSIYLELLVKSRPRVRLFRGYGLCFEFFDVLQLSHGEASLFKLLNLADGH